MRSIIHATSIIGCSISLMFCLLAVLVLGCYREKTRLLLIKQQQSITLVFINIVMLTGFQGLQSEELCKVATTLLHYFVLACFSWLTADQYFIFKSVVKMKPYVNFMKIFIAAWGFPVPFLVFQLLVGFLLDQDIGSILYSCWGSDFVALTLLIPAGALSIASITMLSITVKAVIKRPAPTTYTRRKTDQAIKYGIKTSSVMIFITVIVWIFAHLLFWYPDHLDFQLIFALSSGLQGLFNFFFYCVFALELDIYVSDKLFSETDDVDEFTRNTGSVKLSSINRQDIQNMESLRRPQKKKRNGPFFKEDHDLPPMIEEEPLSFHKGKTTPTTSRRLSDPLPWFPVATSTTNQALFGGKIPGKVRQERSESQGRDSAIEDEASGALLDEDVASPPPFLRPIQSAQRIERAKENAKLANSLLLQGDSFSSVKSEKQQVEPRRSSSLPSCSMPTPNRYVTAADAPGYGLGGGLSVRHERLPQPLGDDMGRSTDIEDTYSHALFENGGSAAKQIGPCYKINGPSRVSVPTLKSTNEIEVPKERDRVPAMAMTQVQPYCGAAEGQDQDERLRSNSDPQCNTPEVHGNGISLISKELHPLASRGGGQRSNSHELEKTYSCLRGATGGKKPLSPRGKRRARTSVPSLKFALNELESLFSNQDLISASERRMSAHSDNH